MTYHRSQLRQTKYQQIVVSPHMDDAAYSCGGRILQTRERGERSLVVTVFGTGPSNMSSDRGVFANYQARSREELAAMHEMDADFVWLNAPELLFRKKSPSEVARYLLPFLPLSGPLHDRLFTDLLTLLRTHLASDGVAYFPFAVGSHPDHRVLFDVGRALHALGMLRVHFYDDVPYAHLPVLRALHRSFLGTPTHVPVFRGAGQVNRFAFPRLGRLRYVTWLPIFLYLSSVVSLRALLRKADRLPDEPAPARYALDIEAMLAQKADVLRLYPSQTGFFFTLDARLAEMIRNGPRATEYSWVYPESRAMLARLSPAQRAAAALPGSLSNQPAGGPS